jgi:hypothetical protein
MATKTTKKGLSVQEKTFIVAALQEILEDPDFGLELSDKAKKRLNRVSIHREVVSASEIKRKYY